MIHAERLAVSRPMYAFNPGTFQPGPREVEAVWFRRKNGLLHASMGHYHFFDCNRSEPGPETYGAWVERHVDNRYGATHLASWDGAALLSSDQPVTLEESTRRIAFLDRMLREFPGVPAGFDGWWTFPR